MVCTLVLTALCLTPADFDAHVAAVHQRVRRASPGTTFHVVVEPPFVVIGDGPREQVQRRARGTVRWATRRLREAFFARGPERILEIWLFRDDASYRRHTLALFGDRPDTPYGYYSNSEHALIMNIGTGGGTLVHELVHPYIEADFPDAPAWFDEGMGSLFEHAAERDAHIVGLPNWRLPILVDAIRSGDAPSLRYLVGTSWQVFYGDDSGVYYAQARYLLYYLQELGVLGEVYRRFRNGYEDDPTGERTLRAVLGVHLDTFQPHWERWVLDLGPQDRHAKRSD